MAGGKVREATRNKRGSRRDEQKSGGVEQRGRERTEEMRGEERMGRGKVDKESGPED